MAHFYGTLKGNRGEATRLGSKDSGIRVTAESWSTIVKVRTFHNDDSDKAVIELTTKHGNHLFSASFDAESVARHAGTDVEVDKALRGIEHAFARLDDATRDAEARAEAIEVAEAVERGLIGA